MEERHKIADRLRIARTLRGYSQQQVADRLNRHQSCISRIERGQSIDVQELVEFSKVYNVDVAYFYQPQEPDVNQIFKVN